MELPSRIETVFASSLAVTIRVQVGDVHVGGARPRRPGSAHSERSIAEAVQHGHLAFVLVRRNHIESPVGIQVAERDVPEMRDLRRLQAAAEGAISGTEVNRERSRGDREIGYVIRVQIRNRDTARILSGWKRSVKAEAAIATAEADDGALGH